MDMLATDKVYFLLLSEQYNLIIKCIMPIMEENLEEVKVGRTEAPQRIQVQ